MQGGFIMAKMATWNDVNRKISTSNGPTDKCPTKAEIEATGKGEVKALIGDNQLVSIEQVTQAGVGTWTAYVGNDPYSNAVYLTGRGSTPTQLMTLLRYLPDNTGVVMTPTSKPLKEVKDMVDYVGVGNKVIIAYALTVNECNLIIREIEKVNGSAEIIYNYPA